MKKFLTLASCALVMASCAAQSESAGEALIVMPPKEAPKQIVVESALLKNVINARSEADMKVKLDTLDVKDGKAVIKLDPSGDARYQIEFAPEIKGDFYASPGDNILMQVSSLNPLNYTVEGTELMHGLTELVNITSPIEGEYYMLMQKGAATEEQVRDIMDRYDKALKDFVAGNPNSPAAPFAILDLEGQDFIDAFNALTPEAKKSMFMPFAEGRLAQINKQMQIEQERQLLLSGEFQAPDFTFKDMDGKDVSLSDFRGKWVVIDFWGSWCGWCIKGIPQLKEAYNRYKDKLVVLGVACNDTPEAWRAAVKKYELPWVNVYNDQTDGALLTEYGIQGFPTKGIVNPAGKLVDLTTGEDPSFYDRLADFLK